MNKILLAGTALLLLSTAPASAQIIIQPTIVETQRPVYVVEPVYYPVHVEHHRRYNWRYWQERREHEEHEEHERHEHERFDRR